MRDSKSQAYIGTLAIAVLLSGLGMLPAARAATDAVTQRNDQPPDRTVEYWTDTTTTAAVPMPLVSKTGTPFMPQQFGPPGPSGSVTGFLPGSGFAGSVAPQVSIEATTVEPKIFGGFEWYPYPPPHTRYYPRFGNTYYPHSTLGKLFFSDGATNYVCSGAAVVCKDLNLVMTAGHCCAAGNGATWYSNFLFVPACVGANCNVGGTAPFGRWTWESVTVPTAWFYSGDLGHDVCLLKTAPNGSLQELHQVTGSLGLAWNQTQPVHYTMTGWPAAAPFAGDRLVFEIGSTADLDGTQSPNTVGVGNYLTGGSSGGAWIKDYKQGAGTVNQYWNGLNSYKYNSPDRPSEMYGPYPDTTVFNIWSTNIACQ